METTDNDGLSIAMTQEMKKVAGLVDVLAGRSHPNIAEFNKLSLSFVYEMKMKLEVTRHSEDFNTKREKSAPCPDSARIPEAKLSPTQLS